MIQYNEDIAANLTGLKPVDWDAAKKAFSISGFKPEKLKIVPRDPILRSLVSGSNEDASVEKKIANDEVLRAGSNKQKFLRLVARQYVQLANKGARLPKFSKWVTSLFKDDKELHDEVARYGQNVAKDPFIISCNPVDIMRCADTNHFWSCLDDRGGYTDVIPGVLEECPGIAVAYVNGADGKMKGRIWLHTAKKDDKDVIVLAATRYGNGLDHMGVAKAIAAKGYDVYQHSYYNDDQKGIQFVGCFVRHIHWDTNTWNGGAGGILLAEAK